MNNSNFRNVTAAEFEAMLQQGGLRLLDVRTDTEILLHGRIPQGDPLPLHLVPVRLHELDSSAPTAFYCRMGGRSAQAAAFAVANGFSDVYNLQGGLAAWTQAGLPVST